MISRDEGNISIKMLLAYRLERRRCVLKDSDPANTR